MVSLGLKIGIGIICISILLAIILPFVLPRDCKISEWGPWSSCINGNKSQTRNIITPAKNGGSSCPVLKQTESCPVNCGVSLWSAWSDCDPVTNTQNRTRTIITPPKNGGASCPELIETKSCPIDCEVSNWSTWSNCDPSTGTRFRTRTVNTPPKNGGTPCPELTETEPCPVNCAVSDWTGSTECDPASGTQINTRSVITQPKNGGTSCPELSMRQPCTPIPINCQVSDWFDGTCSRPCGGGVSYRRRTVTVQPRNGGADCPPLIDTDRPIACNTQPCPVDCFITEWGPWGKCDKGCGGGKQTRKRSTFPPENGGKECPPESELIETQDCNTQTCPPHTTYIPSIDISTYIENNLDKQFYTISSDGKYMFNFETVIIDEKNPSIVNILLTNITSNNTVVIYDPEKNFFILRTGLSDYVPNLSNLTRIYMHNLTFFVAKNNDNNYYYDAEYFLFDVISIPNKPRITTTPVSTLPTSTTTTPPPTTQYLGDIPLSSDLTPYLIEGTYIRSDSGNPAYNYENISYQFKYISIVIDNNIANFTIATDGKTNGITGILNLGYNNVFYGYSPPGQRYNQLIINNTLFSNPSLITIINIGNIQFNVTYNRTESGPYNYAFNVSKITALPRSTTATTTTTTPIILRPTVQYPNLIPVGGGFLCGSNLNLRCSPNRCCNGTTCTAAATEDINSGMISCGTTYDKSHKFEYDGMYRDPDGYIKEIVNSTVDGKCGPDYGRCNVLGQCCDINGNCQQGSFSCTSNKNSIFNS